LCWAGAGKSTLMDILAMRLRATSGTILVGGRPQTSAFRTISSYVPQVRTSYVPQRIRVFSVGIEGGLGFDRSVFGWEAEKIARTWHWLVALPKHDIGFSE
jgi:ABC-type cobalamin/Fe3+-siderophores transport system ATPase subunit